MRPSKNLMGVLKIFNSYVPIAKQLEGEKKGIISGGYGTVAHPAGAPVKVGDLFTEEYAEYCLGYELNVKCKILDKMLDLYHLRLNQNQFDALARLVYSEGLKILQNGERMGEALRSHDLHSIAAAFGHYNKRTLYLFGIARSSVCKDLVAQRADERSLFERWQDE